MGTQNSGPEGNVRGAFMIQEYYCRTMQAPIYARLCKAIAERLTGASAVGARILAWPGEPTRDALPLRFIGATSTNPPSRMPVSPPAFSPPARTKMGHGFF